VLLRCEWRGNLGWHPVTMPVTKWLPMSAGRYLGYPKYVADTIGLSRDGDCWQARAIHRGAQHLMMTFEPSDARDARPWEAEAWKHDALSKGDVYLAVPPGKDPTVQRVSFAYVEPSWASCQGVVRIERDEREAWAGLVPRDAVCPAEARHFVGGLNLVAERLCR